MRCHDCGVEVEPKSYPEGKCPECGLTYILKDDNWEECCECGEPPASEALDGKCLDCYLSDDEEEELSGTGSME